MAASTPEWIPEASTAALPLAAAATSLIAVMAVSAVIPAKTYPGQDKDNQITSVQNILVANASMTDQVAYEIVKTFIEHKDDLVAVHGEAKNIELAKQTKANSAIPWHPGAVKYFVEKGVKM